MNILSLITSVTVVVSAGAVFAVDEVYDGGHSRSNWS